MGWEGVARPPGVSNCGFLPKFGRVSPFFVLMKIFRVSTSTGGGGGSRAELINAQFLDDVSAFRSMEKPCSATAGLSPCHFYRVAGVHSFVPSVAKSGRGVAIAGRLARPRNSGPLARQKGSKKAFSVYIFRPAEVFVSRWYVPTPPLCTFLLAGRKPTACSLGCAKMYTATGPRTS